MSDVLMQQYIELAETTGGFIHDMKNHLGTVLLNLQLLAEDFENPETQRERRAVERIQLSMSECQRLVDLSNDFLRYARVEELHCEPTAIDDIVGRMVDFIAPTARQQNVLVNWYPAPDLPKVSIDREMFEKVLLNLMLNAEDAMPNGGTLTLQARTANDRVELEVIDTGIGISPEGLAKLFRPFHTTKSQGNGLGLATARKIILAHQGNISVQSALGRGTKITIDLPIFSVNNVVE
jgi:two-component system, NtrC family, sensor histidine kinase HydH